MRIWATGIATVSDSATVPTGSKKGAGEAGITDGEDGPAR
jgi:hypothetical protein